jgi:hypothetical protein
MSCGSRATAAASAPAPPVQDRSDNASSPIVASADSASGAAAHTATMCRSQAA